MRVLVLGGTRFIGPAVVARLLAAGHDVTLAHRGRTGADRFPECPRITVDRRRLDEAAPALRAGRFDAVCDMLAMCPADATAAVEVFQGATGRLVVVSSVDVYRAFGRVVGVEPGPPEPGALTEDAPFRTVRFPYRAQGGASADYDKIPVEETLLGAGDPPATVVRLPMVYGPGDGQHRFGDIVRRVLDGRPVFLLGATAAAWRCARIAVDDAAAAIVAAATHPRAAGRVYHVAEPDAPTLAEWAALAGAACGWTGRVEVRPDDRCPEPCRRGPAVAQDVVLDTTRIRRELGYAEGRPRAESVGLAVDWEREHPAPGAPTPAEYAAEDAALAAAP